jgi:hypothetical protein
MNQDGRSQQEALLRCPRCDNSRDPEDNFCRHCGAALRSTRMPMLRDGGAYEVAPWRGPLPVAVRGAAVVAAGTLAEAILRRLIGRALRRSIHPSSSTGRQSRLPARRQAEKAEPVEGSEAAHGDDHVVSETFLFRRVRLRRQGWPDE